jgi:hypothetical protein
VLSQPDRVEQGEAYLLVHSVVTWQEEQRKMFWNVMENFAFRLLEGSFSSTVLFWQICCLSIEGPVLSLICKS